MQGNSEEHSKKKKTKLMSKWQNYNQAYTAMARNKHDSDFPNHGQCFSDWDKK